MNRSHDRKLYIVETGMKEKSLKGEDSMVHESNPFSFLAQDNLKAYLNKLGWAAPSSDQSGASLPNIDY